MSDIDTLEWIKILERRVASLEAKEHSHLTISLGTPAQLTISAGVVTRTQSYHTIETQGGAGTDDLDTINGGLTGDILIIEAANSTHDVVVKDMTGNIQMNGDFTMDHYADKLMLIRQGSYWFEIARSTNA